MKEQIAGKLWYLSNNGEPAKSRYVFTVGCDEEAHKDRLDEFLAENPQYEQFTEVFAEVPALGVKSMVPKFDMRPMDLLKDESMNEKVMAARDNLVANMTGDEITQIELFTKCPFGTEFNDMLAQALAIQWMCEKYWVVQAYQLKRMDTGKLLPELYDLPSDWPEEIYDGEEIVSPSNLDVVTHLIKTTRWGKQ